MMRALRTPRRYLLLAAVTIALLVSAMSIVAARRAQALTPADCASDCREQRDKKHGKCDELPEAVRDKCKENANKQYDKCIERC
ncbi:MAG TPA: hypothetical protein VJS44_10570, partial [Pyrinomonadaceae bacterium]|nr:hypothetical protein [Pyrinomonadaceae bacterium]